CYRAHRHGFHLRWVPEFVVFHSAETTWRQFWRKAYSQGRAKKNHGYAVSWRRQLLTFFILSASGRTAFYTPLLLFFWLVSRLGGFMGAPIAGSAGKGFLS